MQSATLSRTSTIQILRFLTLTLVDPYVPMYRPRPLDGSESGKEEVKEAQV